MNKAESQVRQFIQAFKRDTQNKAKQVVESFNHIIDLISSCKTWQASEHYLTVLSAYTSRREKFLRVLDTEFAQKEADEISQQESTAEECLDLPPE